ncbi:MAG: leucine-rich repeat domain-containing protein [Mycoplasmoidaceae bacterium]
MKKIKLILSSLAIVSSVPLVSLVSCGGDKPGPEPEPVETYTISGGSIVLTGKPGQSGIDTKAWAVKDSKGQLVEATLSIQGVEPSSDFPTWIDIYDGKVYWTSDAAKGSYRFKVEAAIEDADSICSDEITLVINESPTPTTDFNWNFDDTNKKATITKYIGYGGDVIIPPTVEKDNETYDVTSIGEEAFRGCWTTTSVIIPNSVTSIGDQAFGGCTFLSSVTISNKVTMIPKRAFTECGLFSVIIPNSVTNIGDEAFLGCSSLTSVTIGSGVKNIGQFAFNKCISLSDTSGPDGACGFKFSGDSNTWKKANRVDTWHNQTPATQIECSNGRCGLDDVIGDFEWIYNDDNNTAALYKYYGDSENLTIPSTVEDVGKTYTVTSIGNAAFFDCDFLTSVIIPDTVTSIGVRAFEKCTGLTSITIPNGSIGSYAFSQCSALTSVIISDSVTSIGASAFAGCSKLSDTSGPGGTPGFNFEGTILEWGGVSRDSDWHGTSVSKIKCSNGTWAIDAVIGEFGWTYNDDDNTATLVSSSGEENDLIIPPTVEKDGKTYTVTSIGESVFNQSDELTSVIIPNTIESIGISAFNGCSDLTDTSGPSGTPGFNFEGTILEWGRVSRDSVWHDGTSASKIKCSNGICGIDDVEGGFEWTYNDEDHTATLINYHGVHNDVDIPSTVEKDSETYTVTSIGEEAFQGHERITLVTIPDSVTSIGESAFSQCSALTSVSIPNSVTSIGESAFEECKKLTSITIPNGSIGDHAFSECSALTSVHISDGVTSIGESTFKQCTALTFVIISSSVTSIGTIAFEGCSKLTDTSGPDGTFGFKFLGAIEKWKQVDRGFDWHIYTPATQISCSDGPIDLDAKNNI